MSMRERIKTDKEEVDLDVFFSFNHKLIGFQ